MSDQDDLVDRFHDLRAAMTPAPELVAQVLAEVVGLNDGAAAPDAGPDVGGVTPIRRPPAARPAANPSAIPVTRRRWSRAGRWGAVSLGGVMAAGLAAVMLVGQPVVSSGHLANSPWPQPQVVVGPTITRPNPTPGAPLDPKAYATIYATLAATAPYVYGYAVAGGLSGAAVGLPQASTIDDRAPTAGFATVAATATGTNTQVAGIDEGDIVKTDGSYLYIAHGRVVTVLTAAGADSHVVAMIDIAGLAGPDDMVVGPVVDLMIDAGRLVVLTHGFAGSLGDWTRGQGTWLSMQASNLKAVIYDIADPSHPRYVTTLTQSGTYLDSRLSDGVLYLVSNEIVDPATVDPADPATYVPGVDAGGGPVPLAPGDIHFLPVVTDPTYSVVTAIDVAAGAVLGRQAVLGRADTIYLSPDNLYLASTRWAWIQPLAGQRAAPPLTIPGQAGDYDGDRTTIVRMALAGGALAVAAQADLPGTLLNQFALDELDGNLRVVTTWTNTTDDWTQTPALWVLDPALNVIGSLPRLSADESVQSVRFDQGVAYVVTFRQIDPLFTIDLSDPTAPVVRSALKIPGFSSYLHPFRDSQLLGLGVDADTDGRWQGLKLSMFDVSDPYAVLETAVTAVTGDSSDALWDHKAVFVDTALGLVGFPVTTWQSFDDGSTSLDWDYDLYTWDGQRFGTATTIDLIGAGLGDVQTVSTDSTTRGLRIGQDFYVVTTAAVGVYDLSDYGQLTTVSLG